MAKPRRSLDTRAMRIKATLAAAVLVSLASQVACSAEVEPAGEEALGEDELKGGAPDLRFAAAGYLSHGATSEAAAKAKVACGATLVSPNVVVTAAHCVQSAKNDVWVFGTGNVGEGTRAKVVSVRVHPEFHETPTKAVDVRYFLKNFDVATLVLDRDVVGVVPARLPEAKTPIGCGYRAIGYRAEASHPGRRRSATACVQFRLDLGGDPIFEVHPAGFSALCHGDGDEGSALVADVDDKGAPLLHGIYVGSVTQGLTDCRRGTQFLNGYEAMHGFRAFVTEGIEAARER